MNGHRHFQCTRQNTSAGPSFNCLKKFGAASALGGLKEMKVQQTVKQLGPAAVLTFSYSRYRQTGLTTNNRVQPTRFASLRACARVPSPLCGSAAGDAGRWAG